MNTLIYVCKNCARHIFYESSVKSEYTENNEYVVCVNDLNNVHFSRSDIQCSNCRRKIGYQFMDEDGYCCMNAVKALPVSFVVPSVREEM